MPNYKSLELRFAIIWQNWKNYYHQMCLDTTDLETRVMIFTKKNNKLWNINLEYTKLRRTKNLTVRTDFETINRC